MVLTLYGTAINGIGITWHWYWYWYHGIGISICNGIGIISYCILLHCTAAWEMISMILITLWSKCFHYFICPYDPSD